MQTATASRLANVAAVEMDALTVRAYLLGSSVRFDVGAKVGDAEDFSNGRKGASLWIPSKLVGTSHVQAQIAGTAAAPGPRYRPCLLSVVTREGREDESRIVVMDEATCAPLGFIQDKHTAWLLPLLTTDANGAVTGGPCVYVLAFTGGEEGKPTRGVNIAFTGVAEAVRDYTRRLDHYAAEDAAERAYESGSVTRIHALTDAEHAASEHATAPRGRDGRGRFLPALV